MRTTLPTPHDRCHRAWFGGTLREAYGGITVAYAKVEAGRYVESLIPQQVQRDAVDCAAQRPRVPHRHWNHGDSLLAPEAESEASATFSTIAVCSSSINRFMPIHRLACSYGSTYPISTGGGHHIIRHFSERGRDIRAVQAIRIQRASPGRRRLTVLSRCM